MTQLGLSRAIGCTPQHISAIERGAKTPTLETFVNIAAALRVPADVLLQDVLPDWREHWELEIDRFLAPLMPHMRAYIHKHLLEEKGSAQADHQLSQR